VTSVGDKKDRSRFTIQFSEADPLHCQAVEYLNYQGRRSKAAYIASAILCYENRSGGAKHSSIPAPPDAAMIEAIVRRLLSEMEQERGDLLPSESCAVERKRKNPDPQTEEVRFGDALDALGEECISVIAGTLDAFRRK
jgi:hypothetical protein